jgi:GrpB-like predicted nucleotidyltransferase (UPF0157 family)
MDPVFFQSELVFRERARALAAQETARIRQLLPAAGIQHIGGTSVPGALTKGDVDLLVLVGAEDFAAGVERLREIYVINQPENWTPTFASFKDDNSFVLPFGAQLLVQGAETYRFVTLRDRLRGDAAALAEYNAIKRAHHGSDHESYRAAKGAFIERLLAG